MYRKLYVNRIPQRGNNNESDRDTCGSDCRDNNVVNCFHVLLTVAVKSIIFTHKHKLKL